MRTPKRPNMCVTVELYMWVCTRTDYAMESMGVERIDDGGLYTTI
jgi:hypothetical protein